MTREPSDPFNLSELESWEVLARYLAGESPVAEAEAIRDWLVGDPSREVWLTALDRSLSGIGGGPPADLDVEAALRKVKARIAESDVRPIDTARPRLERRHPGWRTTTGFRVAASLVFLIGAALVWRSTIDRPDKTVTWATAVGQADSVRLPDGSFVLLGPESRLTLADDFGGQSRELDLAGEGFFNVVHDETRPFTVRAGGASIIDLGTAFTVRSTDGETVHVVVTEGAVRLESTGAPASDGVTLSASDRGTWGPDGHAVAQRAAATDADLAWTRGRLVFDDVSLDRVAVDLRRWYGIRLEVADPELADRHLTATFEDETIDQVLDVIGLTIGARTERTGDRVILRMDGSGR